MTFSNINVSNPNDGLGDKLRDAFVIVNDNFDLVGDMVTPEQLSATLSNYATVEYVDNKDVVLQNQINGLDIFTQELDATVYNLQTDVTNLGLLVGGKASLTQLNDSIADINNTIAALQLLVDTKITDAPVDGKTYGRQDGNWTEITAGGALPYRSYTALLSQIGTDDPTAVELQNDFTATITYNYQDVGKYKISSDTEIFTKDKTICFYTAFDTKENQGYVIPFHFQWWATTEIYIYTEGQDDNLRGASIEIRVY